ncbi:MAG TPA: M28 family metallopeptidase [Gaiellaceae bacterium]|nr:M28 family metallopeptidase [Gaiellaceae bacterium]
MRRVLIASALLALAGGAAAWSFDRSAEEAAPNRFDGKAAWSFLKRQVALGPRPAGSRRSRELATILRRSVRGGRFQAVPGGLRNVVATIPGRNPRRKVVLGAHYDTKDLPGFVGANDGASGTAVVRQLARTIKPRQLRPTLIVVFFDGEEVPKGRPDSQFERYGLRGSKVAARAFRSAEAAVVLDFVGDRELEIPREQLSNRRLWSRLRAAAGRAGASRHFPAREQGAVLDDHVPFVRRGVPAIDLIDFDFPCWHERCDNLTAVSEDSLDAVGETMMAFLAAL